jgi:hypothetical protein
VLAAASLPYLPLIHGMTAENVERLAATLVGNAADSPELLLRASSATGHDAEILEG